MASTSGPWSAPSSTGGIPTGPGCARQTRPASPRPGTSSSGSGTRRPNGPAACPLTCCTSRSTASGRSSRRCATWCLPPTPGSGGRFSAIRRRGTRLDLPWDEMPDTPGVPRDRDVRPSLDAVLELRRDRMSTVRQVIRDLTGASLDGRTEPVEGPGWPPPRSFAVRECLLCILNEEWEHRLYAERDLDALESRRT